jgi:hypothetical protein
MSGNGSESGDDTGLACEIQSEDGSSEAARAVGGMESQEKEELSEAVHRRAEKTKFTEFPESCYHLVFGCFSDLARRLGGSEPEIYEMLYICITGVSGYRV